MANFGEMNHDENHTAIERVINNVKEANITFENFRKHADTIDNNINVVLAQIENNRKGYQDYVSRYGNAKNDQKFKRVSAEGLIPVDVFKLVIEMNKLLKDTISWQEMKASMYYIMYQKLFSLIDEANALTIKKEAIQEMREMENKRNEVILDTFQNKFRMFDERFDTMIRSLSEAQKTERREMIASFERIINTLKTQGALKENIEMEQKDEDYSYLDSEKKKERSDKVYSTNKNMSRPDDAGFDDDGMLDWDERPKNKNNTDTDEDEQRPKTVRRDVKKTNSSISDIEEKYKDFDNEAL